MIDGTELYTRNGQLGLNSEGGLVTQAGQMYHRSEIPRGARMFPLLKMVQYLHNLKTLQNLWLLELYGLSTL